MIVDLFVCRRNYDAASLVLRLPWENYDFPFPWKTTIFPIKDFRFRETAEKRCNGVTNHKDKSTHKTRGRSHLNPHERQLERGEDDDDDDDYAPSVASCCLGLSLSLLRHPEKPRLRTEKDCNSNRIPTPGQYAYKVKVKGLTAAIGDTAVERKFQEAGTIECLQRNSEKVAEIAYKREKALDKAMKIEWIGYIKIKVEMVADAEPLKWTHWEKIGDPFGGKRKKKDRAGAM